jgi:Asp/Glu/hydantoin racemase
MLGPNVLSRMKERHNLASNWICCFGSVRLVAIAALARKGQIVGIVSASMSACPNVFD